MNPMLKNIFKERRSIRRYLPHPVPISLVMSILEDAGWAPSAHNRQPWRFQLLMNNEEKHSLALQMGNQLRIDRLRDNDDSADIEADVARSYQRITQAPVVIVVFLTLDEMDNYPDAIRENHEYIMAIQSTAMAVQNILLSSHLAGLGACWMCAPLFCADTVIEALQVPRHWIPQALVTMGYPANEGKDRRRKPLTDVSFPQSLFDGFEDKTL